MKPFQIARPCTVVAQSGDQVEITRMLLGDLAASYDRALSEAPIVVGHPKTDSPAYGYIDRLELVDDRLVATPRDINPEFAEAVRQRTYNKVSMSYYLPGSPSNPKPGMPYLKHVGFLGGAAPAIKGLPGVHFSADEEGIVTGTIDLAQPDGSTHHASPIQKTSTGAIGMPAPNTQSTIDLAERERALAEREARISDKERALKLAETRSFVEGLIADGGRILPRDKDALIAFMINLEDQALAFGEGEPITTNSLAWLKDFLSRLPKQVDLSERAPGADVPPDKPLDIAKQATAYQSEQRAKGIEVSDIDAVAHVTSRG